MADNIHAVVAIWNIEAHPDQTICSRRCNRLWQSQQPNLSRPANILTAMIHLTLLASAAIRVTPNKVPWQSRGSGPFLWDLGRNSELITTEKNPVKYPFRNRIETLPICSRNREKLPAQKPGQIFLHVIIICLSKFTFSLQGDHIFFASWTKVLSSDRLHLCCVSPTH